MWNITAYLGNKAEAIDHFKNVLKAHAELNGYDMNELWKVAERLCEYLPDKEYGMERLADYNRVLCDKRMYWKYPQLKKAICQLAANWQSMQ